YRRHSRERKIDIIMAAISDLGSARVSRAGERSLAIANFLSFSHSRRSESQEKIIWARRRNQHARRVRYAEFSLRSTRWRDCTNTRAKRFSPRMDSRFR